MLHLFYPHHTDAQKLIAKCLDKGYDHFRFVVEKRLFVSLRRYQSLRIEIKKGCGIILRSLQEI